MTDRQFDKLEKRVSRIFDKFQKRIKRMVFDDSGNLYGETVKNAGWENELNIAYYVVLGKKIYIMTINHDFTRSYAVMLYRKTIFGSDKIDIKVYDGSSSSDELFGKIFTLSMLLKFAKQGYPDRERV